MDQVSIYIKKLIALTLSAFVMYFLIRIIPLIPAAAFGFLVLSFLHFRITGEKPAYLFGIPNSDKYLEEKGGFWVLFRWILILFGLIYDLLAWTLNGIYVLFLIFIDILLLIKSILFWIIHAVLWFLSLFVAPLVFLFKMFLHYLIYWPWWIYKVTFANVSLSVNNNFFRVAVRGAILALFIILLFYGAGILTSSPVIAIFGVVFSIIPVIWAFGEISSMRFENRWNTAFNDVKARYRQGFEAIRAVLFYLTIMLAGILIEIVMDMLGWIPYAGFSLLGLTININTFVTLILLFVFVILLFASLLIPPHTVYARDHDNNLTSSVKFLGIIGEKFLRYLVSVIPATFFSGILAIIPAIIVGLSIYISLNVKNIILDARISNLTHTSMSLEGSSKIETETKVERLKYYKEFPGNVFTDFTSIKTLNQRKTSLEGNYRAGLGEMNRLESMYLQDLDSLKSAISNTGTLSDSLQTAVSDRMQNSLQNKTMDFEAWKKKRTAELASLQIKINDLKNKIFQLPIAFLFTIIWLSVFGGLVFGVVLAYLGNVFFGLYGMREDGEITYWRRTILEIKKKDQNQPLLGFTLLFILLLLILFFIFAPGNILLSGLFNG